MNVAKTNRIAVRLDRDLYDHIMATCRKEHITITEFITGLVEAHAKETYFKRRFNDEKD